MRTPSKRLFLAISLLVGVLAAGGVAVAAATGKRHRGLSLAQVQAAQSSSPTRVIVLLRNQHTNLPPTRSRLSARHGALQQDQSSLQASVKSSGGKVTRTYTAVNAFAATVSKAERAKLAANSSVAQVFPDTVVRRPNPGLSGGASRLGPRSATPSVPNGGQQICPTDPNTPLVEPEALSIIHADQASSLATGQGVKVAFVAEGIDTGNPDFIRPDGSHVFVDYQDFSGDGPNAPTSGAEAFGDASSIAAQGMVKHDLSKYVNPAHPLPAGCNVVIRGVSPGASLVGIKVFGQAAGAFTSVILQGLDWAVSHDHVDVLNESFGSDPLPDTSQDVIKQFNRLAVAAGTTVTVSSGDQGTANTIGSPASDPSAIDAGATTQFRHFAQTDRGGYQLGWRRLGQREHRRVQLGRLHSRRPDARPRGPRQRELRDLHGGSELQRLRQLRRPAVGHPLLRRHQRVGAADRGRRGTRHPGVPEHPRRRQPVARARQAAHPVEHQRPGYPQQRAGHR